jgi:hypothetical protein
MEGDGAAEESKGALRVSITNSGVSYGVMFRQSRGTSSKSFAIRLPWTIPRVFLHSRCKGETLHTEMQYICSILTTREATRIHDELSGAMISNVRFALSPPGPAQRINIHRQCSTCRSTLRLRSKLHATSLFAAD